MKRSKEERYANGLKSLVLEKIGNRSSCMVTNTKTGMEYFFSRNSDGYSLYEGCDLVVGDTSLEHCVYVLAKSAC